MFNNLGIVIEALSDTELKVYNSVEKKDVIVKASKDYVSSIKAELNDEDREDDSITNSYSGYNEKLWSYNEKL